MPKAGQERKTLLGSLDALVEKYHLLKHPFYRAWTQGKLSKQALALYAEQYYQHVQAFPENLKDLADRTAGDLRDLEEVRLRRDVVERRPARRNRRLFEVVDERIGLRIREDAGAAVRADAAGEGARLPAGRVLIQRQGRTLRELPGRRHDQDRDELPAGCLHPVRGM